MAENVKGEGSKKKSAKPPCRACVDFKSWSKTQKEDGSSKVVQKSLNLYSQTCIFRVTHSRDHDNL